MGIQITPEGNVVVRAPKHYPKRKIKQFVRMKKEWIHKKAEAGKTDAWYINAQPYQKEEKAQYLDSALEIFAVKADYYASLMGVSYEQIQVMEKYGQWGKCTKDGRLFFNWRLILAPEEVLDYPSSSVSSKFWTVMLSVRTPAPTSWPSDWWNSSCRIIRYGNSG